jgi:hypothetical protein
VIPLEIGQLAFLGHFKILIAAIEFIHDVLDRMNYCLHVADRESCGLLDVLGSTCTSSSSPNTLQTSYAVETTK